MLERNELARAMTELPDELLLEQERTARPQRIVKFRRIIAAAATIALLAVTVGAASAGITWDMSEVSRWYMIQKFGGIYEEYYDGPSTMGFHRVEYRLPLTAAELPEENRARIERLVTNYGNRLIRSGESIRDGADFYLQNYNGHYVIPDIPYNSFGPLEAVEEFLGIPLDVPAPLRKAIAENQEFDASMVWVRVYARPTADGSALAPDWVEIRCQLTEYAEKGQGFFTINVALSEEAAQEGMLVESYSYEKEGPIWQEERTVGGYTVEMYGNDPQEGYDGSAGAVYTSGGIGYHIAGRKFTGTPDYYSERPLFDTAKDIVLSLLEPME